MTLSEQNCHFEQRIVSAAGSGDISTVRKLLRKKINVTATDVYGRTALSFASKGGHAEVVKLLLESNADCVNQKIGYSATPLHLAARNHHTDVVKHLVLAGASLDERNCNKLAPLDLCRYDSDTRVVLRNVKQGHLPLNEQVSEVPEIPKHALPERPKSTSEKTKTKGKTGKGKKKTGGKKKGTKKKGKKK
ncbi:ankyrin repeat domain-containing protein 54-like [Biomphalaria glabrata]|uniref:Ankyrin repeat domain-containing protein 54-like n=1 Tax=Biomphalaria glabrata TaxID=6526 RepID=A0A9W3BAX7_BIOGL|nr:ankyrin repeat domain-containing protein 54-like [Biomphalaria glabrata]XP_055896607.1 ankyrin repeat domain-containing protein 54-like [Biomphalaria glabrata]XP_055896608.1 ankyrin repeat domain-containing protein 54-like [Biomphalaria glabrata]XP_055896609.1 ankyrin repeat domain-containing protein 54-like [Biomphalaria glabrata]XP_055896610.1 ankyrin repeat domain-containing protein 54-like [Biomphalaria glabrata]XP_055896612.1 ankyrin repeat domain-containing protein 54-like [Biomphalar